MTKPTDTPEIIALIARAKGEDYAAFSKLVSLYNRRVVNLVSRTLNNPVSSMYVDDIVQEIWIRVWRYLHTFRGDSLFYSWLYTIIINRCREYMRQETKAKRELLLGDISLPDFKDMEIDNDTPEGILEAEETLGYIIGAIDNIESTPILSIFKEILILRYINNLEYKAIARELNIPINTVRSRLHRAKKALFDKIYS